MATGADQAPLLSSGMESGGQDVGNHHIGLVLLCSGAMGTPDPGEGEREESWRKGIDLVGMHRQFPLFLL